MRKTWPISIDCPNCAAKLEAALQKLPGVEKVSVNYVHKRFTLEAADGDFDAVLQAVLAKTAELEPDTVIHVAENPDECKSRHAHGHSGDDHPHHEHDHHHEAHAAHEHSHSHGEGKGRTLLMRIGAAVLLAVCGFAARNDMLAWICFALAYLAAGYDVLWTALRNLLRGDVFDENFLMSVASLGAMLMGESAEAIAVMALYQVGEYFQDKAVDRSRASITSLMDLRPDHANVLRGGDYVTISPQEVRIGEIIRVLPGERIPMDGVITEGASALDTAALTGESLPRDVAEGDVVLSGCVNGHGLLQIRVTTSYGESTVAKILALVENSGEQKASSERFITRFARVYTPIVCLAALLLALIPGFVTGNWQRWIYQALTFLVISCPCALVISVPLAFFAGIGAASRQGVLIKGANYLEQLSKLDTVALDKTGTLTRGVFRVQEVAAAEMDEDELLALAAHAESCSNHPISLSLQAAYGREVEETRVSQAHELAGHGVSACVDGRAVLAGNARLMEAHGIAVPEREWVGTVVHLAVDGTYVGSILISDELKPTAAQAVAAMKQAGVSRLVMLTGDGEMAARAAAQQLELTDIRAGLLPGDKVSALEGLLGNEYRVAFVGDGVNDAPVLRRADVGVAMGGLGSDAAIEAADVVLMNDDPMTLPLAIRLSRRTMTIVRQNIVFALGFKGLVMFLGLLGIANMWLAVFADVGVAMLAILNACRLNKM